MAKAAKIDDVKRPERVLPSATSRPILVTDHSTPPGGDPMLAPADDAGPKADAPSEPSVLTHTAKTIEPLAPDTAEPAKSDPAPSASPALLVASKADAPAGANPPETPDKPARPEPTPSASGEGTAKPAGLAEKPVRDPEAAQTAEETAAAEAEAKRETELEDIIAGGQYAVPINAVQRRRSRSDTVLLCLLALLLLLLLADAIADVGLVKLPSSVPHTHFFSKS